MAKTTTKGIPPDDFFKRIKANTKEVIDTEMLQLEKVAVEKSPSGVSGNLRQRWNYSPFDGTTAILSQSQQYFFPVEFGRKPGKGISAIGQRAVARWAKLKLGITNEKSAKSFAYLLSEKYKKQGREPQPIIDLEPNSLNPKPGGELDKTFKEIDKGLGRV